MTSAAPPLRVLVVGSSVTYMVVPTGDGPADASYPQLLRGELADRGLPAEVWLQSRWYGRVDEFLRRFEAGIRDPLPDVVVLDVGLVECQARVLPNSVVRHLLTWDRTSRPGAHAYRRLLAAPAWRVLRAWQRVASPRAPLWLSRLSPRRFHHDTRRLIDLVRTETGAAVVVLGVDSPGPRLRHWLPGVERRATHYDRLLRAVVGAADDPGVVHLSKEADTTTVPVDELVPDGLHRTPEGHRLLAARLADTVAAVAPHARTGRTGGSALAAAGTPDREVTS